MVSCLRFYKILKSDLAGHRPLSKLFAFKLLVGLNLLMNVSFSLNLNSLGILFQSSLYSHSRGLMSCQIVFWILNSISNSPLDPTSTMSEADVVTGIPAVVNCLIMVPFSVFFHYAYDVRPYLIDRHLESGRSESHHVRYQGGLLGMRAFAGMLDPGEILGAIGFVFKMGKQGAPGKRTPARASGSGRDFGNLTNNESHAAGLSYEMSGREQRRVRKPGRVDNSRRYEQKYGDAAPANPGYGRTAQ